MFKHLIEKLKTLFDIIEEYIFDVYCAFAVIYLIILFFVYISE